jgi:membrane dipeptidase
VGIGSDFDGIPDAPRGLDAVDLYPALFVELARRGWTDTALAGLAGNNLLRALREAEAASARLKRSGPADERTIAELDHPVSATAPH